MSATKINEIKPTEQKINTYSWGLKTLDKNINGLREGEVTLLAAATRVGKTTFTMSLCTKLVEQGLKITYVDLENGVKLVQKKLYCAFAGCSLSSLEEFDQEAIADNLPDNIVFHDDKSLFELPRDRNLNSFIAKLQNEADNGTKIFIIDPLTVVTSWIGTGRNSWQIESDLIIALNRFARDTNTHVIINHHVGGLKEKTKKKYSTVTEEENTFFIPTMYDIRGSETLRNQSQNVIVLARDVNPESKLKNILLVKCEKAREGRGGNDLVFFDVENYILRELTTMERIMLAKEKP